MRGYRAGWGSPEGNELTENFVHRSVAEIAVEIADVFLADGFRTDGGALVLVGAVAESFLVHLADHGQRPTVGFWFALWEEIEMIHLGGHEQHGAAIFTGSHARATSDARCSSKGFVSVILRNRNRVGQSQSTSFPDCRSWAPCNAPRCP